MFARYICMEIELLSKMVKEIILEADSVTLPGLGSFVAEVVPSSFSDRGYTINPPYRRLYFSPKEGSDTLLVDFYSRSNNIGRDDATRIVVSFLQQLKNELKESKAVVFPGLGRLRATRQNNFFFVSDEDLDIYPYGFGLSAVSLKTHKETDAEVSTAVADLAAIISDSSSTPSCHLDQAERVERSLDSGQSPSLEMTTESAEAVPEDRVPAASGETSGEPSTPYSGSTEVSPEAAFEETVLSGTGAKGLKGLWVTLGVAASIAVVALAALAIIGRTKPELIDKYLYTAEELELVNL